VESALCDSLVASDTYVLEFKQNGKNQIVANKISPDAFVQMSILLAKYMLYGRVVSMYEPAMNNEEPQNRPCCFAKFGARNKRQKKRN
jgi:Choline/Carnitine o-acyltransferase